MERSSGIERLGFEPSPATEAAWQARAHLLNYYASQKESEQARWSLRAAHKEFTEVVRLTEPLLYGLTLPRTNYSKEAAEDIVQETYLNAFRKLPGFRGQSQVEVWLYRIATNEVIDFYEREAKHLGKVGTDPRTIGSAMNKTPPEDPEKVLLHKEFQREVIEAISSLRLKQWGTAVFLFHILNLSHGEIGKFLGVSKNNSKAWVMRGLEELRERGIFGKE